MSLLTGVALGAAPAAATVVAIGGTSVGIQPRESQFVWDGTQVGNEAGVWERTEGPASFNNPAGHPVLHSSRAYAIYWDPTDHYHGDWQGLIDGALHDMNADSGALKAVFAVDSQYTDLSNQPASYDLTFRGSYTDTDAYPPAGCTDPKPPGPRDRIRCLSDTQIQEELASFISQRGLQKGMGTIFYMLTPPGVTVCVGAGGAEGHCSDYTGSESEESYANSFCSYHSAVSPTDPTSGDANTILYAVIPWTAGGLGDGQLELADRTSAAYACQDGGFDPTTKPIEKKEKTKQKSAQEIKEFEAKTEEEQERQLEREELETPHVQEPNQVPCPSPDGFCDTGLADLIVNQIAVEQQNTVTDPLLNAWQDSTHRESTDECRNFFAPTLGGSSAALEESHAGTLFNQVLAGGRYYLNTAFNLAALRLPYPAMPCIPGVRLVPKFTSPSPVNTGDLVGLDGMESLIDLNAAIGFSAGGAEQANYATYTWNFGDGTPTVSGYAPGAPACSEPWLSPCAATELHSYQYGGTYNVTLTVTDVGGNRASVTHQVTVDGPPAPSPGGGSGSGTQAGTGSSGSSAGSGAGSPAGSKSPTPTAAAAVSSHSLRTVLRRGLVVRYSVSERVTGRFEVLLARSLARRLGLHGPSATGLAPGTPPQVVIGKAFLVTTGGGRNTVTIQFSKATDSRLSRLHGVSLMLRLVVRNASTHSATVITTVTLTR